MTDSAKGATSLLAAFAAETTFDDVPPGVTEKVTQHAVDALGAMHAGSSRPWTRAAREHVLRESAPGACSLVGHDALVRPGMAALVNATATHGLELDDYHVPAAVHAGCVVVPAGFAVAQDLEAHSRALLTAMAVGYEVVVRLGLAMSPEMTQDRGFHVTSAFGALGAAATAANLRRLSPVQSVWALGIAAAQSGGTTEFTRSGGEVKRLHAGLAASAGLRAADLAVLGVSAPAHAIEGPRGFAQALGGRRVDLDQLVDGLGSNWHLDGLGIKAWSTCTGNHAPIAALSLLCEKGLDPEDVASIDVYTDRTTADHCGHIGPVVADLTGAQFSLHVTLAMRLVLGGNDLSHYLALESAGFDLAEVTRIARLVHIHVGEEEERAFAHAPTARVVVRLGDGRELSASASPRGAPHAPFTWADIADKLHRNAGRSMSPESIEGLLAAARAWSTEDVPIRGMPGRAEVTEVR